MTVTILAGLGGCATLPRPTIAQKKKCMVYVLPGIEGPSPLNANIVKGLIGGGVDGAVEIHDWTTGHGPLAWFVHLTHARRNRLEAYRLARRIIKYHKRYPDRPVFLVAHSGGAGIAVAAVEVLPKSASIEGVILLAGAVSPDRDLTRALARVRRGIWNFHSKRDIALLTLGTMVFGTMDRKHTPGAGAVGFRVPEDASDEVRAVYDKKLHQIAYDPSMIEFGHYGTHHGWTHPPFVAHFLAPIITGDPMPGEQKRSAASEPGDDSATAGNGR